MRYSHHSCENKSYTVLFCRESLEHTLADWQQDEQTEVSEAEAQQAWRQYEALTSQLAQDLCEQLRLVLEPSQASKLK